MVLTNTIDKIVYNDTALHNIILEKLLGQSKQVDVTIGYEDIAEHKCLDKKSKALHVGYDTVFVTV